LTLDILVLLQLTTMHNLPPAPLKSRLNGAIKTRL